VTFLRTKGAADVLGLTVGTLANLRYRGCGPEYTRAPNGVIYYDSDALRGWVLGEVHSHANAEDAA
jgi:hypothetical protein